MLMNFKSYGVRFVTFMGTRWFVSKSILIIFALYLLSKDDTTVSAMGFIMIGYIIGAVSSNIKSFIATKKQFELTKEFVDWEKIQKTIDSGQS